MVDPITAPATVRSIASDRSVSRLVSPQAAKAAAATDATDTAPAVNPLSTLVAEYAATPPIDEDRVARIRHAIATNTYPILPETVADRLLALKLNWNANDAS